MIPTSLKAIRNMARTIVFGFAGGRGEGRRMKSAGESLEEHLGKGKEKMKEGKGSVDGAKQKGKLQIKPINWKKYGHEVSSIFEQKKEPLDIDLVFIARKVENKQLLLTEELTPILKAYIKQLKSVQFSLIPPILDLSFSLGLVNPPQIFLKSYLDYYRINTFTIEENQALNFPSYFLKRIGLELLMVLGGKDLEEFTIGLRHFGSILSLNQLKKIDQYCSARIQKMEVDQIVKLLNIFRQIRRKGSFVELSQGILITKQKELSNRSLIMATISLLQLGNRQAFTKLEGTIAARIGEKTLNPNEVVSVMHILHKYKVGGLQIWNALHSYFIEEGKKIPFEHIFVVMSGLSRNYRFLPELLLQLIQYDPVLKYAEGLKEKQFVEFYFVIFAHFTVLPPPQKQSLEPLLKQSLLSHSPKSIYLQLKHFFLFLLESSPSAKKEQLRKAYPNDTLLSLLSHIHAFQNTDIREQKQYEEDLLTRIDSSLWQSHRQVIVAEQFIRYKLISALRSPLPPP